MTPAQWVAGTGALQGHAGLGEMAVREKNEKLRRPIKSRPGSQLEPVSTETPKVTKKERLCVSQAMGSQATDHSHLCSGHGVKLQDNSLSSWPRLG